MSSPEVSIDVRLLDHPVEARPWDPFPPGAGAECVFLGRTRLERHPEHGLLTRLSYEAYRPMAERVLQDLAARAAARFGCLAIRLHHAIGEVPPGAASVLVQVAAAHREEAFAAARFLIDSLKQEAPIWKREAWADGSTWSAGAAVSAPGDPP
ncbi:MAG: molybdenum cofactor biosynthesis protein MoaE [Planctomycetota bacterium]|jgi:molybdopterin synthase catalytic subunit